MKKIPLYLLSMYLLISISGCKTTYNESIAICEKAELAEFGEIKKKVTLLCEKDFVLEEQLVEEYTFDPSYINEIYRLMENDNINYTKYENVSIRSVIENEQLWRKEISIDLHNANESVRDLLGNGSVDASGRVSYTFEEKRLKDEGYACKLVDTDVKNTIVVKSLRVIPKEKIFFKDGRLYSGYQIVVTFEPYDMTSTGLLSASFRIYRDQQSWEQVFHYNLGSDIYDVGYIPAKADSSFVLTIDVRMFDDNDSHSYEKIVQYVDGIDELEIIIEGVPGGRTLVMESVPVTK